MSDDRLTPAEIQQQLIQCTDLLDKFATSRLDTAHRIASVRPPAPDAQGSVAQANAVAAVGRRARRRLDDQADFLRGWYQTLISARERYLEQEHLTEAEWNILARQRKHDCGGD